MHTPFGRWVGRYRPTFLYIGGMCVLYVLLVWGFMNVLWPLAFQNAEPIQATAQNTADAILSQRADFKNGVQSMYYRMGTLALILYLFYCWNGWLTMTHAAHVRFSKDLRLATVSCFLTFALNECATNFIFSANAYAWDRGKLLMIIISILSCVWWIFLPHIRSAIKNNQIQSGKKFHPVIYSLLAVSAFLFMTFYDGILTLIYNGFKELINPSANPVLSGPILSDPSRFVLYLNVDYLLPLFLLVPLAMLWFAMWYASPVSASTPFPASTSSTSRREHIYAMVHSDFPA